jgi:hypothetical protein
MNQSQALALVGTLQAAFPAGSAGRETVQLYATKLEAYDVAQAARAVNQMIDTRRDAFLPTWAEIHDALVVERPRPLALSETDGVPPTPEQQKVIDEIMARGDERASELQRGVRVLRAAVRARYERDQADTEATGAP